VITEQTGFLARDNPFRCYRQH